MGKLPQDFRREVVPRKEAMCQLLLEAEFKLVGAVIHFPLMACITNTCRGKQNSRMTASLIEAP